MVWNIPGISRISPASQLKALRLDLTKEESHTLLFSCAVEKKSSCDRLDDSDGQATEPSNPILRFGKSNIQIVSYLSPKMGWSSIVLEPHTSMGWVGTSSNKSDSTSCRNIRYLPSSKHSGRRYSTIRWASMIPVQTLMEKRHRCTCAFTNA